MIYRDPAPCPPSPCDNCDAPLPARPMLVVRGSASGYVCDNDCANGWCNGERAREMLDIVRDLQALIAAPV